MEKRLFICDSKPFQPSQSYSLLKFRKDVNKANDERLLERRN